MANQFYYKAFNQAFSGNINLASNAVKIALLTNAYSPDVDHSVYTDVSGSEVSGAGYTAGGATLGSKTLTEDTTNNRTVFDAADPEWLNATLTARYAAIYQDTGSKNLLCLIDFGADKSCVDGTFKIVFSANGVFYVS